MAETAEMKTLICPGPPEHTFEIPKGRGRPPRYCPEHKPDPKSNPNGKSEEEKKVTETRKPPPRPAPPAGGKPAPRVPPPLEKGPLDEATPGSDAATMTESGRCDACRLRARPTLRAAPRPRVRPSAPTHNSRRPRGRWVPTAVRWLVSNSPRPS